MNPLAQSRGNEKKMGAEEFMGKRLARLVVHSSIDDDGYPTSNIVGGICWNCWKTAREIMDCKMGDVCNESNKKWAAMGNTQ